MTDRFGQQMAALLHKETKGTDDWRDDVVELFERQQRQLDRLNEQIVIAHNRITSLASYTEQY